MPQVLYNLVLDRMQEVKLLYTSCMIFFSEENTKAVFLIDVENAFNSINRKVMLHNMKFLCPLISTYICNCYAAPASSSFFGGGEILSKEGSTQGDPTSMGAYALDILYQCFTLCLILF